jgi:hypothetical protein
MFVHALIVLDFLKCFSTLMISAIFAMKKDVKILVMERYKSLNDQ